MAELLKNSWQGWQSFNHDGKLAAALLISLVVMWVYYGRVRQKSFLIYTTAVTLSCVIPVTGAVLMLYQTYYYDYRWVWSIVPMTAAVAYAIVLFVTEFLQKFIGKNRKKQIFAALILLAGLFFCGGMGAKPWDDCGNQENRRQAGRVLDHLQEKLQGVQICLWAPREVMEYARAYDAGIELIYGRNMWDPALNVYSYESYSREISDLYQWMEAAPWEEESGASDCALTAVSAGVNCILLPADKSEETVECFENTLGVPAEELDGYYLFIR